MTTTELMHAVLALDAYNRTAEDSPAKAGVNLGEGGGIGDATVSLVRAVGAFFAQSYLTSSGEKIIAFRGTDDPLFPRDTLSLADWQAAINTFLSADADPQSGYGIGIGSPTGPQARAAAVL